MEGVGAAKTHDYLVDPDWGSERERLALLAEWADPFTISGSERIGVGPGWHCLEAGAGGGSIARWLADRVGPTGRVVAADIDDRFLTGLVGAGVEVMRTDLRVDDLPHNAFDLVHCRFLLAHLPHWPSVVRRMLDWVRPGGWLHLEDGDISAVLGGPTGIWRVFWEATAALPNLDAQAGGRLCSELQALGLTDVDLAVTVPTIKGRDGLANMYQLGWQATEARFIESGLMTAEQGAELCASLADRNFVAPGMALFGTWGRRPLR